MQVHTKLTNKILPVPNIQTYIIHRLLLTYYKNVTFTSISQNIASLHSEEVHSWSHKFNSVLIVTGHWHCDIASDVVKDLVSCYWRPWGRSGKLRENKIVELPWCMYIHVYWYGPTFHVTMIASCVVKAFKSSTASGTTQWRNRAQR